MIRVFYAQPVDAVSSTAVRTSVERLRRLIEGLEVEIVAPYLDETTRAEPSQLTPEIARQIVQEDYQALDSCDAIVVDMSDEERQAVGMVFEMAYAWSKGKKVIVYAGASRLGERVWVVAIADCIGRNWEEVRSYFERSLQSPLDVPRSLSNE